MAADVTAVDRPRPVVGCPPGASATLTVDPAGGARPTADSRIHIAVGTVYALLVTALWIPFGPRSGMGYETTLVYVSESRPFFEGFFYDGDALRPFTQLFYQVGYQLSSILGIDGSFLGNQLVYAALWWGRGFLAFLIMRRLFPAVPLLAYATGALVIVHASDHALNWVGQLNQFGVIFWMMLAVYLLVVALQQTSTARTAPFAIAAGAATYFCLWSYESPLFILFLAPLLLLPFIGLSWRTAAVVSAFYVYPLVFVLKNLGRYVGDDGATYQESLLRDDLEPTSLVGDLVYNLEASIAFWRWDDPLPLVSSGAGAALVGVSAAVLFAAGTLVVSLLVRGREEPLPRRHLSLVLGAGALVLLASFPAYLALDDARSLWRTQFLSGVGFGIASAALLVLAASLLSDRRLRVLAISAAGAVLAYAGGSTAYRAADWHYSTWQRHRDAIAQVLEIAPRVEPETVIVLTNLPDDADPFGHNMWFDVALRLAYPRTAVAGLYFYADGEPSPGANLAVRGDRWEQQATGFPTLLNETDFSKTLIVRYSASGKPALLERVPRFLRAGHAAQAAYNPSTVIEAGEPSPLAERRYQGDEG